MFMRLSGTHECCWSYFCTVEEPKLCVHCRFLLIPLTSNQLSMWLNVCVWRLISPINGKIQYTKRCLVKPTTPSLPLLIHQIIAYHNHTIYKLFTSSFITFPLFIPHLFICLGGCDVWMVDGIPLLVSQIFEFATVSCLIIFFSFSTTFTTKIDERK